MSDKDYNKYIAERINKAMSNMVKEFVEDLKNVKTYQIPKSLIEKWEKRSEKE